MNTKKKDEQAGTELEQRIEAAESGYEFLLAYAAQGRTTDKGPGEGKRVREFLQNMETALEGLGDVVRSHAAGRDPQLIERCGAFLDAVDADAGKAQGAIRLVLAQADISSQLVDNLNASIHLRALLTDLFVIDEAFKPHRAG